jgi:hypothetical protein
VQYIDSDKLVKVRTTGVYESSDGVHHFVKAGRSMPVNWKLTEECDSLVERQEVMAADDADAAKAAPEPENKADKAPEKK